MSFDKHPNGSYNNNMKGREYFKLSFGSLLTLGLGSIAAN